MKEFKSAYIITAATKISFWVEISAMRGYNRVVITWLVTMVTGTLANHVMVKIALRSLWLLA